MCLLIALLIANFKLRFNKPLTRNTTHTLPTTYTTSSQQPADDARSFLRPHPSSITQLQQALNAKRGSDQPIRHPARHARRHRSRHRLARNIDFIKALGADYADPVTLGRISEATGGQVKVCVGLYQRGLDSWAGHAGDVDGCGGGSDGSYAALV